MLLSRCAGLSLFACLVLSAVPARVAEKPDGELPDEPLPAGAVARLGTMRFQQGGVIHAVAFSPDGKRLASAGEDSYVRLWDPATGRQTGESTRHYHGVHAITYSRDGKHIASVSHGAVRLLDGTTGKQVHIFRLPKSTDAYLGPVHAAAFSPDGATVATGLNNKEIQLWDAASGAAGLRLKGHTDRVSSLLFCADGKLLASASDDATIRLWDPVTGETIHTLQGHKGRIAGLAIAPDGKVIASAGTDGSVRLWDPATGGEVARIDTGKEALYCLTFAPDGKTMATGGVGPVRLWDVATGKELRKMAGALGSGWVAFSPDGKTLAATDGTSQVGLWDPATGKPRLPAEGHLTRITALAFAPDGKAIVSGGSGDAPRLWDLATGKVLRQYGDTQKVRALAFAPDGQLLTAATADRRVRRWDDEGKEVQQFRRDGYEESHVVLSPDGRFVAWGDLIRREEKNDWQRIVGVWDTRTGKELVQTPSPPYQLYALAISPDGRTLLSTGSMDRNVGLWETATGQRRDKWPGPEAGVSAAAFALDGRVLVTGGWDNNVWVRDVAAGKNLYRQFQAGTVYALAISPGGRLVASAGGGHRAVLVRDLATGKELHRFAGHRGDVWTLTFSPDGKLLASGGDDGLVLVWDVSAAQKLATAPRLAPLQGGDLKALWADLVSEDAERANRAVWGLAASPKEGADFLKERLRTTLLDAGRVKRLLARLDDDDFDEREKAQEELASLGRLVEDALRQTLETRPSLEVRTRINLLLGQLKGTGPSVEEVRGLRSVEALERMGSPEARAALEVLASGAEARVTQAAKAALERLGRPKGP